MRKFFAIAIHVAVLIAATCLLSSTTALAVDFSAKDVDEITLARGLDLAASNHMSRVDIEKETRSVSVTEDGDYILTVTSGDAGNTEIGPAIMAMRLPVRSAEGVDLTAIAEIDFGDLDAYRDCSELGSAIWFDGTDMHEAIAVPGYEHLSIERIWLDGVFGDFEYAITAA